MAYRPDNPLEPPSQMFEEWTITPSILQLFAQHYQTGEPIPAEMVKQLRRADDVGKALAVGKCHLQP